MVKQIAPYGSWVSPISAGMVGGKAPKINDSRIYDNTIYWCEAIADEKGRVAVMRFVDDDIECVLPRPLSVRSKVHEYGGAAYCVHKEVLYFVLADDQRIYRLDLNSATRTPEPLTPALDEASNQNYRFADLVMDENNERLIAVAEQHLVSGAVENFLVSVPTMPGKEFTIIAEGEDFYSTPRLSPSGNYLSWLTWSHPNLPWDNTCLWLAEIDGPELLNLRKIIDGENESIFQPQWSPSGDLYYVSDKKNWWNLYSIASSQLDESHPNSQIVFEKNAEFATPAWTFGMSTYGFLDARTMFATYTENGLWKLLKLSLNEQGKVCNFHNLDSPCTTIQSVNCYQGLAVFIGAASDRYSQVYQYDGQFSALSQALDIVSRDEFSVPEPVSFETTHGHTTQALFYPPHNTAYVGEENEKPPLIVIGHGGPTGATESSLNLKIQYWTNRGFAIADVNYRGSTGYGREYRHLLYGQWGEYDVDDVCAVVNYLASQNKIDAERSIIKGSSAGGYTVLAALAFRDTFKAGVSLYGIADLELLATDTHKFELRYLDQLVGEYPKKKALYKKRSPIHSIENIQCPLLVFQGLQDKVVPPNQAMSIFNSLKEAGQKVALVTYEDEAHGFRSAQNIEHMLDCELAFYAKIFAIDVEYNKRDLVIHNNGG